MVKIVTPTMSSVALLSLVLVVLSSSVHGLDLPKYIRACSRSDPGLNECAVKSANFALQHLIKGDAEFNLTSLLPLRVPQLVLRNRQVTFTFNDVVFTLPNGFGIGSIKFNFGVGNNVHVVSKTFIPNLQIVGPYDVQGILIGLPMYGEGTANFTFENQVVKMEHYFYSVEKNGQIYGHLGRSNCDFLAERVYIKLDNLYGGHEEIGRDFNQRLNENWTRVVYELKQAVADMIKKLIDSTLRAIIDNVPLNQILTP